MNKFIIIFFFFFINSFANEKISNTLILNTQELNYVNSKQRVYIANRTDWIPFDYNQNNNAEGFAIEYIKLLSKKIGLEPVFIKDEKRNLTNMLKNSEVDILPAMYENKKNKEFIYTTSYFIEKFQLIVNKNNHNITSLSDLKEKKVGVLKDSDSLSFLKKDLLNGIRILEFFTLEDIYDALESGFIDATLQNHLTENYYINNFYHENVKVLNIKILNEYKKPIQMVLKKESQILYELYNKAIENTTQEEIKELQSKWLTSKSRINLTKEETDFLKNKKINVAYTDNWAPLSFNENNKANGLGFDFWEFIAKINGINYSTEKKDTFYNALTSIKNKRNDIILTTSKTPDREKFSLFSDVYFKAPIGIATRAGINFISDIEEIKSKKIGVGKNHTAHALLKEKYPDLNFVFIDNLVDGLQKLSTNEIYAVVEIMPVLSHNIDKFGFTNLKISGITNVNFDLQMMIRDDYKLLQSIINKTLSNMTLEEKNEIYTKWSNVKYVEPFDYSILWKFFLPLLVIIIVVLYRNKELIKYQKTLKETKNQLENSLDNFKNLVDLTIEGIFIVHNSKIIFANNEMLKIFNQKEESIKQIGLNDIFLSYNNETIQKIIKRNESRTYELQGIRSSNITFPCIVKSKKSTFNNLESYIISVIDISEIKEKESILINQSKLASMGEMIGNIAHQWRQPLSIISTSASGLKLQKEFGHLDDETLIKSLENINETTQFLSQTIDDFQDFLKKDKKKSEFILYSNIEKVLNILDSSFRIHEIKLIENVDKNSTIKTYENELMQVILNILNNSKDALKNITTSKRYIQINTLNCDNITYLEFIDNGGGIEKDILNRVFEPYFTTKHKTQGTGLGLYMTHKIITQSIGGEIYIENCEHIFENTKFNKCTKVSIKITNS